MKIYSGLILVLICCHAFSEESFYPKAVVEYLETELPLMEVAVKNNDRSYFESANPRMVQFLMTWGFETNSKEHIEKYQQCTDALTDYQIVGLCNMPPKGEICVPETFIPKFENNLKECKLIANKR